MPQQILPNRFEPPGIVDHNDVIQWSFENITFQQFEDTKAHIQKDAAERKKYLELAFTQVIMEMQVQMQELQGKVLLGDTKVQEKISKLQERIFDKIEKKRVRLENLALMNSLAQKSRKYWVAHTWCHYRK